MSVRQIVVWRGQEGQEAPRRDGRLAFSNALGCAAMLAPSPEAVSKFPDRPRVASRSLQREEQATATPTGGAGARFRRRPRWASGGPAFGRPAPMRARREPFDSFSARGELWTTTITSLPRWSIIVWSILLQARGESKQCPSPFTIFGIAVLFSECPANENTSVDWPMHSGDTVSNYYSRLNQINW